MEIAGDSSSKAPSSEKDLNRVPKKRSHDDCISQTTFAVERAPFLLSHHASVKGSTSFLELQNWRKHGPKSSNNLGHFECLDSALHACEGSFSDTKLSSSSFLTESRKEAGLVNKVYTCYGEHTSPAKRAQIVHTTSGAINDGEIKVNVAGHNTENLDIHLHVPCAGFDENDQTFIPLSCSPTALTGGRMLASKDNSHTAMSPGQGQQGKQYFQKSARLNSRVLIDVTNKFRVAATPDAKKKAEEDDAQRLHQRHKQIEYGRNTLGYERYLELVPKSKRKQRDPRTPNPKQVCSKRSWDGQIRKWRRLLHKYDPPVEDGEELPEDFALLKSDQKDERSSGLNKHKTELKATPENSHSSFRSFFWKETTMGATAEVAEEGSGLSIYEDWVDSC